MDRQKSANPKAIGPQAVSKCVFSIKAIGFTRISRLRSIGGQPYRKKGVSQGRMSNQAHGEHRAVTTTARKNQMKHSGTLQDSHIVQFGSSGKQRCSSNRLGQCGMHMNGQQAPPDDPKAKCQLAKARALATWIF